MKLNIPGTDRYLYSEQIVKLHRFDDERWVVRHGWFSFGGNRPFCGWYLESFNEKHVVKPLQLQDLDDIYVIETGFHGDSHRDVMELFDGDIVMIADYGMSRWLVCNGWYTHGGDSRRYGWYFKRIPGGEILPEAEVDMDQVVVVSPIPCGDEDPGQGIPGGGDEVAPGDDYKDPDAGQNAVNPERDPVDASHADDRTDHGQSMPNKTPGGKIGPQDDVEADPGNGSAANGHVGVEPGKGYVEHDGGSNANAGDSNKIG